jgi:hypothetical protein
MKINTWYRNPGAKLFCSGEILAIKVLKDTYDGLPFFKKRTFNASGLEVTLYPNYLESNDPGQLLRNHFILNENIEYLNEYTKWIEVVDEKEIKDYDEKLAELKSRKEYHNQKEKDIETLRLKETMEALSRPEPGGKNEGV